MFKINIALQYCFQNYRWQLTDTHHQELSHNCSQTSKQVNGITLCWNNEKLWSNVQSYCLENNWIISINNYQNYWNIIILVIGLIRIMHVFNRLYSIDNRYVHDNLILFHHRDDHLLITIYYNQSWRILF